MPVSLISGVAASGALLIRPTSDVIAGFWGDSPLFSKVNEVAINDGSYIYSRSPVNDNLTFQLESAQTHINRENHNIRYRIQKSDPSGNELSLTASLYQNATLISTNTHTGIQYGYYTTGYSLTTTESESITDYSNLRINFLSNTTTYYSLIDESANLLTDENGYYLNDCVDLNISWVEVELLQSKFHIFSKNENIIFNYDRTSTPSINNVIEPEIVKNLNYIRPLRQ